MKGKNPPGRFTGAGRGRPTGAPRGAPPDGSTETPPGTRPDPSPGIAPEHAPDLTRTSAWDYALPPELVARYPAERRDQSRLLVVRPGALKGADPATPSPFEHRRFPELASYLRPGDLLVLNESRVLPVRLLGRKPTGAACEVLLLRPVDDALLRWEALVRPGSKLKPGRRVIVAEDELDVVIEAGLPDGGRVVRLEGPGGGAPAGGADGALRRHGRIPLPPYLEREEEPVDRERYQTVYARTPGSVAAPTAGLHFTPELLDAIEAGGVEIARVTLHVGPGTFRPVEADDIAGHLMHAERWEVPQAAAEAIERTRARGGRVWAVGTTVVRTLESAVAEDGEAGMGVAGAAGAAHPRGTVRAGSGDTRLFLHPGVQVRVVDGLVTNFHLPRSTLLMLVGAMAGYETTMAAYAEAVRERYRFYSYGDAMLVLPGEPDPGR